MRFQPLTALGFATAAAVLVVSPPVATTVLLAALLPWSLVGSLAALQALALSAMLTYVNPGLVDSSGTAGLLIRLVLLAAALRVLPTLRLRHLKLLWPAWTFALIAGATSIAASPALDVSLMKVAIFVLATTTVLGATANLDAAQRERFGAWLLTLVVTVALASALAAVLRPGVAFAANGYLRGVLSHSQALATVLAPAVAALLAGTLLMRDRSRPVEPALLAALLPVMLMTHARTAALAALLGLLVALAARAVRRRDPRRHARLARPVLILAAAGLVLGGAALATGKVGAAISAFVLKRGTEQTLGEAFEASRGGGALQQWRNFERRPLTGHGFGVYPDGAFPSGVVRVLGVPVSAPVEKGFLPTAVLEETGLAGGAALLLLVVALARRAWRASDLRCVAMFVAALAVNLGEAILTAPGGVGMLAWLMLAVGVAGAHPGRARPQGRPAPVAAGAPNRLLPGIALARPAG